MKVIAAAKNGQAVQIIKNYEELTPEEHNKLILACDRSKEDYKNYWVRYNKKGELQGVAGYEFSKSYNDRTSEDDSIDLVDSMQLLFGNKRSKNYQSAKKRAGVTNQQVNAARKVWSDVANS